MIAGIFTAMIIVFSQFFFFQEAGHSKKLVKSENQKKQKSGEEKKACISLLSFSQPSSTHAEVHPKSPLYLFDILFEKVSEERHPANIPVSFGKFLQTLFRVFITPNAP